MVNSSNEILKYVSGAWELVGGGNANQIVEAVTGEVYTISNS